MSNKITNVNNDAFFFSEEGESILDAALRNGRSFNYGCQTGSCGACKSSLVSGKVKNANPNDLLSDEEVAAGEILICQAVATSDIEINATENTVAEGIEIKTMPSRIREKNMLADDVVQLFLSLPKTQTFKFLPGQYLNVLLKDGKQRSFSIANGPEAAAEKGIELHIRLVDKGLYTPHVFADAAVKDIIRFQGPFGSYFLRTDDERAIVMVAGGTGFAPIKGLIEQAIDVGLTQDIYLYWGARASVDLYQHELAQSWADDNANVHYIPVLSEPDADWQGATGFVHEAVLANFKSFADMCVYTSGPPVMVNAVKDAFLANDLDEKHLFSDSFDYAAAADS